MWRESFPSISEQETLRINIPSPSSCTQSPTKSIILPAHPLDISWRSSRQRCLSTFALRVAYSPGRGAIPTIRDIPGNTMEAWVGKKAVVTSRGPLIRLRVQRTSVPQPVSEKSPEASESHQVNLDGLKLNVK